MEDENLTTSTPVEGDVVQVSENNFTPAPEPNTPPLEPSSDTIPQTTGEPEYERLNPQPQTEKTLAEQYVDDARANAYENKGHGLSDWIKNTYDYDQQQAGTMWVAGKINDVATQMSFLEATLNEDMYSELDLQKYFFDTNLATARAYAKEKRHETAYGYYRAAQEKALAEGQLTGWYMPAEANYMLSQWAVANENLKDPSINTMDQARAQSVKSAVEGWFEANNITWRGIECLNHMYYKETVRHNQELERLQDQANEIAKLQNQAQREQNAATAAAAGNNYKLQLREWEFQMAELERDFGYDITGEGVIGHTGENAQRFGFYNNTKEWAEHNFEAGFNLWGTEVMEGILGDKFSHYHNAYKQSIQNNQWFKEQADLGTGYIHGDNLQSWGSNKIKAKDLEKIEGITKNNIGSIKDGTIKIVYTSPDSAALYVVNKDGVAFRITDENLTLVSGKTIKDMLGSQSLKLDTSSPNTITSKNSSGEQVTLNIGKTTYGKYSYIPTKENYKEMYPYFSEKGINSYEKYVNEKGYKHEQGIYWEGAYRGYDGGTDIVLSDTDKEGNVTYYNFDSKTGKVKQIKPEDIIRVDMNSDGTWEAYEFTTGEKRTTEGFGGTIGKLAGMDDATRFNQDYRRSAIVIGKNEKGENIYAYVNHDGTIGCYFTPSEDSKDSSKNGKYKGEAINILSPLPVKPSGEKTYDWVTNGHIVETYTPEQVHAMTGEDISKFNGSIEAYANNIPEAEYFKTNSVEDIIQENNAKATKEQKENLKKQMNSSVGSGGSSGGSSSSGGGTRTVEKGETPTKSSSEVTIKKEKYSEDEVVKDSVKGKAEANLGEIALKEIEQNKQYYAQLLGLTEKQIEQYIERRKK